MNEIVQKAKSYWARPEGKTGMLLLAGAAGAVLWGWGKIVPFVLAMVANTLQLGVLVVALILFLMIVFSPRTHLLFRLLTRAITGIIIDIDPIGILKDRVEQLMKRMQVFSETMLQLRGALRTLQDNQAKNDQQIEQLQRTAAAAKKMSESASSEEQRLRGATELRVSLNEITRLQNANKKYAQLQGVLERIHSQLVKLSVYLEGYVKDAQNEARQQEIQRKTLQAGSKALSTAMKVIRGNATENDIYNTTLEKLADDASRKLGEMEENLRWAEDFMTKVDLQSGGVSDEAMKMLEEFEQKLLPPAVRTAPISGGEGTPAGAPASAAPDYQQLFVGRKE